MAKILFETQIEKIHTELEQEHPCFFGFLFTTYFESTPIQNFTRSQDTITHESLVGHEFWAAKFTFLLLILAAEEELDGYPMEAVAE